MSRKLKPVSPGEMLAEEFLKPLGMSNYRLAKEIGVPAQRIGEIVAGKRAITADTEALFQLRRVARFANIERPALRKLKQLDLARRIEDLRAPPANRLEQLKGDRAGQWSIRVNDQFRICFRWTGSDAEDVEIVNYH